MASLRAHHCLDPESLAFAGSGITVYSRSGDTGNGQYGKQLDCREPGRHAGDCLADLAFHNGSPEQECHDESQAQDLDLPGCCGTCRLHLDYEICGVAFCTLTMILHFYIELKNSTPLVWRRLLVPSTFSFYQLHLA